MLLWTGCLSPGDAQKPKVLTCLVDLLRALQIPFFVLPDSLSCCGDPARIFGEEDLFQGIVEKQVDMINASGIKQILVHCPHCYTVLKDRYPDMGADFSVTHTSEFFMHSLVRGDLSPTTTAPASRKTVYHDPCFLGRYQALYQPPREILKALAGIELIELPSS